jgi:hypothetical protein
MTNKQKKEKKLTFLNHLLTPTFLAQNNSHFINAINTQVTRFQNYPLYFSAH